MDHRDEISWVDDLAAINQVSSLYGHLIDDRAFDRMSEVYTEDGVYDNRRAKSVGLPAIAEFLSTHSQPLTHHTTNTHVEFEEDGNKARGVAKYLCLNPDGTMIAGDYEDHWVRTPTGWRLKYRRSISRGGNTQAYDQ